MASGSDNTIDFDRAPVPNVTHEHHPAELFGSNTDPKAQADKALLILNSPIASIGLVEALWQSCGVKMCADGGANRLWDLFGTDEETRLKYVPDRIHGDLDSLRPDVHDYYVSKSHCTITKDEDKYSTDFGKCLDVVRESFQSSQSLKVVILGSLGGRVDQGIGLLGEMMREMTSATDQDRANGAASLKLWLISEASLTFLLLPGKNTISFPRGTVEGRPGSSEANNARSGHSNQPLFTPNIGILPLFGKAHISTRGLEWDVAGWPTEMGRQVSTSNHIMADEVTVWTEKEVLFTIELSSRYFEASSPR